MGEININLLSATLDSQQYLEIFGSYVFISYINAITTVNNGFDTCIDHHPASLIAWEC